MSSLAPCFGRRWRKVFDLLHVLGIHRLRAPPSCFQRQAVLLRELTVERTLAGQIVGYCASYLSGDLVDVFAWPKPVTLRPFVEPEVCALDERFGQVHGIGDDADVREDVSMPDEVLDHRRELAVGEPVAASPLRLDVSRVDGQDVSVELAGRESLPGVRCPGGRVRTSVHPDGPRLL